jgi:ABC-type branched-subunit amino acid transport system ATPase component
MNPRHGAAHGDDGLVVTDLVVRYGGLVAVDGVSLHARRGRVTGLIGPNGAGKTTMFNACSGLLKPTSGTVHLFGADVTHASGPARAQRGLGRTFQRMDLFDSLLVRENVALGREAGLAGSRPWNHLRSRRADRDVVRVATDDAMELCGIAALADRRPADLSTGQRRLVELARVVAGGFAMLLLDEPSSGLDHTETDRFGEVLRTLVDERGTGLLIVEHDMALVMRICEYLYVLDFGRPIFEGDASDVLASDTVRAAYLGDESDQVMAAEASVV